MVMHCRMFWRGQGAPVLTERATKRASSRCKPRTLGDSRSVSKLLYKVPWQLYVTVLNDNQDIRVNIGMVIAYNGHIYR